MTPVIVLDDKGRFLAAVGSPGGPAILAYNLKALVGVLDWKLTMQQAVAVPNLIANGDPLRRRDQQVLPDRGAGPGGGAGIPFGEGRGENSGLHGVMGATGRWRAARTRGARAWR